MAQRFLTDPAAFGVGYPVIGKNSEAFAPADAVYIDSDGFLAKATTSSKILGYTLDTVTMASDNQTVAKVCPKYVDSEKVLVVYPTASSTALAQTDIANYAVFSAVTSGAQTLNATTSATVGQFLVRGIDPKGDGTTYEAVVEAACRQTYVAATA